MPTTSSILPPIQSKASLLRFTLSQWHGRRPKADWPRVGRPRRIAKTARRCLIDGGPAVGGRLLRPAHRGLSPADGPGGMATEVGR